MQAEKLLRTFPWQYEAAKLARMDFETPLKARDMTVPHVSTSRHSDPTAGAAISLAELSQLENDIRIARRWIATIRNHQERKLLISVWRCAQENMPWRYIAKNAKLHPAKARLMWRSMVDRLEAHMGGADDKRYRSAS